MNNADGSYVELNRGSLLHRTFTAHLPGGEWPDEFTVDVVGRERSAFSTRKSEPAKPLRMWLGTARYQMDGDGVERLVSTKPAHPMPLAKRLSYAAAKADEINDLPSVHSLPVAPNAIGDHKRARMLRPVLFAVAVLTAKAAKREERDERRVRARRRDSVSP